MTTVRLDPADPLASVLAWLAEIARALGLDPSERAPRMPPTRDVSAAVRAVLADWSRQLRAIVLAKALRLARKLVPARRAEKPAAAPATRTSARRAAASDAPLRGGRMVAVGSPGRRGPRGGPLLGAARPQGSVRRSPDETLDSADAAALKARTRAVLLALHDPGALIRRLAHRLARHLALAAARRERPRFPRPSRVSGLVPRGLVIKPELRPPNVRAFVRPAARPAAPAAAPSAFAF